MERKEARECPASELYGKLHYVDSLAEMNGAAGRRGGEQEKRDRRRFAGWCPVGELSFNVAYADGVVRACGAAAPAEQRVTNR